MDSQDYKTIVRSLVQLYRMDNEKWQKEIEHLKQQIERLEQQMDLQERQLKQFQLSHMTRIRQQREEALEYYRKQKYSPQESNIVCDCGSTGSTEDTTEQDTID